jgi:gas vesicle protein
MTRRYFERNSSNTGSTVGLSLLAAAAAAGLTYYLYGTDAGAEKREKIKKVAGKLKDRASDKLGELGEATKDIYGETKDFLKDKYDDLKDLGDEEKAELKEKIRERWEDTKDDIEDMIETAKKEA